MRVSRRTFVDTAGRAAVLVSVASRLDLGTPSPASAQPLRGVFTPRQRLALRMIADEIVPAAEGMPSASAVGAVEYLEGLASGEPAVRGDLRAALAAAERRARSRQRRGFAELDARQRVDALVSMEKEAPQQFRALRDLVYEAYYTRPSVQAALGYEFIGPEASGPAPQPFEEGLLERVRALPKLYREAR